MKLIKKISVLLFFITIILFFNGCEINTDDYVLVCDDNNENCKLQSNSGLGLGKDIEATEELKTACSWVLNADKVNIRLYTCSDPERKYTNADIELPGGAYEVGDRFKAKSTITLSEYQKGVFFGEQKIEIDPESRKAFMIIYRTVFVHNTVHYAIAAHRDPLTGDEIEYGAGNCTQNYRNSLRVSKYESGQYKKEIDETVEATKYLILANTDGVTTDARYHSYTGIEQQIEQAGKEGKSYREILEDVIKTGNEDSSYYKNAMLYDCRNLK